MFRQHLLLLLNFLLCVNAQQNRIVGGTNVGVGQIPSQVSLRTLANAHFCGGAIVTNRWTVTSASCTMGRSQNAINLLVGTVTLNAGGVTHRSQRIVQHPEYHSITLANDISLVQVENIFTLTATVQTINLGIAILGAGVNVQISGWGASVTSGPLSNHLQRITSPTLSNADCRTRLTNQHLTVTDAKLCTLLREGVGACTGDQGGPVIDLHNQLVGVISWFVPCGLNFPDGHERISSHRQWILNVIAG